MKTKTLIITLIICMAIALVAVAEVPQIIAYQGRLLDASGNPVADGAYLIRFRLYDDPSAGTTLWDSGIRQLEAVDGFLNYNLGDTTIIPHDLFLNDTGIWMGIKVGTDPEMTPRTKLASVGHAYHALRADSAGVAENAFKLGTQSPSYYLAWGNLTGVPAGFADGVDNDAGGDITEVVAGSGLNGGATTGIAILNIGTGAVTASHLGSNSVGSDEIQSNAVGQSEIQTDGVASNEVLDNSLTASDLAPNSVGTSEVIDNSLTANDLAANSVASIEVLDNSLTASDLAPNSVGTSEVIDNSLTANDLAANSVGQSEIKTNGVASAEVADNSLTAFDLAANSVGQSEIQTGGVASAEILNFTIVNTDISNSAAIGVNKISGTAVNLSLTQTIIGQKQFGDSTMKVNINGITIGDNTTPTSVYLLRAERKHNTTGLRYGLSVNNENTNTGTLYGIRSEADALTAGSGGTAYGVYARGESDGTSYGLYGFAQKQNLAINTGVSYGVFGIAFDGATAYGIYGAASSATTNWAGYFAGNVKVTGTLSKGAGSFQIDHPLDPENKYLYHSFVESPDMMNVYNGNVELDGTGTAVVNLPDYFDALNKDFRYQLTSIGAPGPNLYISSEISGNQFMISGGEPNSKVSWQVTGVRQDKFANANRIQVEVDKRPEEKGLYIHPEAYNLDPVERSINREQKREEKAMRENIKEQ